MKLSNLFKTTALLGVLGGALAHVPTYAMEATAAEDDSAEITRSMASAKVKVVVLQKKMIRMQL